MGWLLTYAGLALLASSGVRSSMLVSTDWLAGHLADPEVVVLHVARDKASYDAGHIPRARFLPYQALAVTQNHIPNELPPVADLQRLLEGMGLTNRTRIVLYGDVLVLSATRAYFTLDYLGLAGRAALLDGGLEKWRAEQRPVTTETPQWKAGRLRVRIRPEVVASLPEVRSPAAGVILLDARSRTDYAAGHIPGAVNVYWLDGLVSKANPVLRPADELRRLYEAAGITPASRVITYCGSGVQATHSYFALRYLGYRVALYDGSLTEWRRQPDAPLVQGPRAKD